MNNKKNYQYICHKQYGERQELFFFDESAPGMPYWLPKGLMIKQLLLSFWREYHAARNYHEVQSPLLNKLELWEQSGHLEHYREGMVHCRMGAAERYALKPMNCANAMVIFKRRPRSYRELPLRLSDCDLLHRNEPSGSLSGLFRARCFSQDDAHNFLAPEQIPEELIEILKIVADFYGVFGLRENVLLKLSGQPKSALGDSNEWNAAEAQLKAALEASKLPYEVQPGEGAFYGPKIDIHIKDSLSREWQCGTIQLDYQLPKRFNLSYIREDGLRAAPVVIHRAIYGSFERFLGILLEHYAGRLPFWLCPEQLRILPVGKMGAIPSELLQMLEAVELNAPALRNRLRYSVDSRRESLGYRIRDSHSSGVALVGILGKREVESRCLSMRHIDGKEEQVSFEALPQWLQAFAAAD